MEKKDGNQFIRTRYVTPGFSRTLRIIFCFIVPAVLVSALIVMSLWGEKQRARAEKLALMQDGTARKNYTELTESVYGLNIALSKLLVSEAPNTLALALDDIWSRSGTITALMGSIPEPHPGSIALTRLMVQTGDYARGLSASVLDSRPLTAADREQLLSLYEASRRIYTEMAERLANGNIPSVPLTNNEFFSGAEGDDEYPVLAYDGPFSNSAEERVSACSNEEKVTEEQAAEAARKFLALALFETEGVSSGVTAKITPNGKTDGKLGVFSFTAELQNGRADIAVTECGAHLAQFRLETDKNEGGAGEMGEAPDENELDALKQAAQRFLERLGAGRTEATYVKFYPDSVLMSFVPVGATEGGTDVLLMSDTIRLRLERGSGRVIDADLSDYLFSHCERTIADGALEAEEAAKLLSPNLEVKRTRLALIPMRDLTEKLCIEYLGSYAGGDYLVYLDASTGDEAQIFRMISDSDGTAAL